MGCYENDLADDSHVSLQKWWLIFQSCRFKRIKQVQIFLHEEKVSWHVILKIFDQISSRLDDGRFEIYIFRRARPHSCYGKQLNLFEQLVKHGVSVTDIIDGQTGEKTEETQDQDKHAVKFTLVWINFVNKLLQFFQFWFLISLETWKHMDDELGVDLILQVLVSFLVKSFMAILIFLANFAFNNDALNLKRVDLLLM